MYNLYDGGVYDKETGIWTPYGEEATGMQDSNMIGYLKGKSIRNGAVPYSSDLEKRINYSDYNGSIVEEYVNNYKNVLSGYYGLNVIEARLITYDELVDSETLDCNVDDNSCYNLSYPWLTNVSYWTGNAYNNFYIWFVNVNHYFSYINYTYYPGLGIRPVIVIPKSTIIGEKEIFNIIIAGNTYQAEEGMTWEEWIESDYNLVSARKEDSSSSSSYIFNGDLCEVLSYKGTGTMIFSDELIDKNKEYYFRGVSYCK